MVWSCVFVLVKPAAPDSWNVPPAVGKRSDYWKEYFVQDQPEVQVGIHPTATVLWLGSERWEVGCR